MNADLIAFFGRFSCVFLAEDWGRKLPCLSFFLVCCVIIVLQKQRKLSHTGKKNENAENERKEKGTEGHEWKEKRQRTSQRPLSAIQSNRLTTQGEDDSCSQDLMYCFVFNSIFSLVFFFVCARFTDSTAFALWNAFMLLFFFSCACSRLFLGHRRDVFGATLTHTHKGHVIPSLINTTQHRPSFALCFSEPTEEEAWIREEQDIHSS